MILSMTTTVLRTTQITVGLPPEQAMALFTPEGERRWAEGWDLLTIWNLTAAMARERYSPPDMKAIKRSGSWSITGRRASGTRALRRG
jgi:hypothetical protein